MYTLTIHNIVQPYLRLFQIMNMYFTRPTLALPRMLDSVVWFLKHRKQHLSTCLCPSSLDIATPAPGHQQASRGP